MLNLDTQTCNKCHTTKPLNQFHRKGNGHHKTCKACRNAIEAERYQTPTAPRQPSPINPDNFIPLQERIVALEPKLRAKASSFAHDNFDADDIYAEMVEAILTKSKPEESDIFLLQRANWTAQTYIARNQSYSQYVEDLDVDESEAEKAGFKVITNPRAIEDEMVMQERYAEIKAVIETLPVENQKIVAMLSIGKKQREIAKELKVSEQKISESMKAIRTTLKLSFA